MSQEFTHDVLVIGSGGAGLSLALNIADHAKVAVICKSDMIESSTYYAQGGIAAVIDDSDSVASHVNDTLIAGAGLCNEDSVRFTVENSKQTIEWLIDQGVDFTRQQDADSIQDYHLTKEGGHSHRRVVHADDATGKAVSSTLTAQALAHPNIDVYLNRVAVDLIIDKSQRPKRCIGAYVLNSESGEVEVFRARFTSLATGAPSHSNTITTAAVWITCV